MKIKEIIAKFSQAHWLFVIFAIVFGLFYVFVTPPLWGIDESAHFGRVYQMTHGDISPQRTAAKPSGELPENLLYLISYSHNDLADNVSTVTGRKDVDSVETYNRLLSKKFSDKQVPAYNIANYSPLAYIGPIAGVLIADIFNLNIGHTLLLARILSLLTYICIVGSAIYLVKKYKIKWFLLLTALLPTTLFNGSTVSADTMLIASCLLAFALFIRFILSKDIVSSKKLFIFLGLFALIIPLIKVNYALLSAGLIVALPLKEDYERHSVLIKTILTLTIIGLTCFWYFYSSGTGNSPQGQLPEGVTSSANQLNYVLNHPFGFLTAIIRSLQALGDSYVATGSTIVGWNYISVPIAASVLMLVAIFNVLAIGLKELSSQRRYFILPAILSMAGIVSVFLALYLADTPTALLYVRGVQGRYFIPFIIPIAGLVAAYSPIKFEQKSEKYIIQGAIALLVMVSLWTAFIYFSYTY